MADTNDILKEVAKDAYADLGHPIAQPSGELVGLVPRAIKAALAPLERWILQREYSVAETKKLLEEKLKNVPVDQIQPPEAYIAVPALQYISYCMDNNELRDMYANLLANSMTSVVRNGVHPGFVEIIKQLCPDEAKILKYLSDHGNIPIITLRCKDKEGLGYDVVKNFSNIGELAECEETLDVSKYFDNLMRLGLLRSSEFSFQLSDELYAPLKNHRYILSHINDITSRKSGYNKVGVKKGYMEITDFGSAFCEICLETIKISAISQNS